MPISKINHKFKSLLDLDSTELFNFRVYSFLAMFFLPSYGLLLLYFVPGSIEFIFYRSLASAYWAVILIYSYAQKEDHPYFAVLFFIGNIIMICLVTWIVYKNQYTPEFSLGMFLLLACCAIIARSRIEMMAYSILFYVLSIISFIHLDHIKISPVVFLLSISIMVFVYFIVMTWRERAVFKLQRLNNELSFKNEELERFVFAVSHDLKSPLRTIGSFSSLLQRRINNGQTESVEEYTDYIISGVNRMSTVIEDILDYSRYGNSKIQFEDVAVKTLIQQVKQDIIADEERKDVVINLSQQLPNNIIGNASQVKQIFQNLIENAIKYNLSNDKKVWIDYKADSQFHRFQVADNGIGIEPQYKEKIFELFQRLHHKDEFNGTGIGLAICKRIIENHQGSIQVLERNGGGTVFQFQIKKHLN